MKKEKIDKKITKDQAVKKILLVCSPYYKDITSNLIKGASEFLKSKSVDYKVLNVPGALEIAPAIKLVFKGTVITNN